MAEPLASWTLVALAMTVGCACLYGAFRLGRHVTDMAGLQLREHAREMAQAHKATERQIARIRHALVKLVADPRAHGLLPELQRVLELTQERKP